MTKILVTGATGFIGKACVNRLLNREAEIHAISTKHREGKGIKWHQADLMISGNADRLVHKIRPDLILHVAWEARPPNFWHSDNNLKWLSLSLELLKAFKDISGKRIVIAGTCAEYQQVDGIYSESSTPIVPSTIYGESKAALHNLAKRFCALHDIEYVWGRIFNVFGPYEPKSKLVAAVTTQLLMDKLVNCTPGTQVRDFMHVDDVGAVFTDLLFSTFVGSVNVASGQPIRVRDLALLIANKLGKQELINFNRTMGGSVDPPTQVADVTLLNKILPAYSFSELDVRIDETIDWWRHRLKIST